ncbi:hypothetical protein BGZ61DRAFT_540982 [Ilyonectria robusta]|uniref:uncharacterized protein n=1 Tax=Ilyonectria robusta TaxID=1079257 RepID=UPI001E8E6562|nr:uncharacterized protein BGZ61DRAFT_540982 [Ilyonectria robusta]KAH8656413.1 hypothetical protein BGZ61DRAFT_540982 [Ilyonectria robusta]
MPANPPKRPGQPKLRTSCDQCGATKVKCDRGQPECGRCVSYGRTCVYGVSRKMGKPPRVKLRSSLSRTPGDQAGAGAGVADVRQLDSSSSSDAWDAIDENTNCIGLDALDSLFNDLNEQFLPTSPSLNLGKWALTDHFNNHLSPNMHPGPFPTPESTDWGSYPSTEAFTAQPTAHQSPSDTNSHSGRTAMPSAGISGHDCPREAYDILRHLSFPNLNNIHSTSSPGTTPASATSSVGNQVPLDHVLRLSSEASERLGPLLTCSCARSPHLAFLYASIISRVLLWYQQAAGYTHGASWSHVRPDCSLGMGGAEDTATTAPYTTGLAVAPAKMAIGSFNVDDPRIQTALKIQLLSGEMGRAGRLIDQFTSLNSGGQCQTDESNFGSVDRLYQSLHLWLRGEHSRIANLMRLKLRELNT